MDLLEFCRQVQKKVQEKYILNGSVPLNNWQVDQVLGRLYLENEQNCFPKELMRHEFVYLLFSEASHNFFPSNEMDGKWEKPNDEHRVFKVSWGTWRYMCLLQARASRPADQQAVMKSIVDSLEPVSVGTAMNRRVEELAEFAFNSIYYGGDILGCYLSGLAVAMGLPLHERLHPTNTTKSYVFCLKELDNIDGVNPELIGDNRLSYANLLHTMIYRSVHHFFDVSSSSSTINAMELEDLSDVRRAVWLNELVLNQPSMPVHLFADFMIDVSLRTGIDLSNANRLDAIEEDLFDTIVAMHAYIHEHVLPILGKAYGYTHK